MNPLTQASTVEELTQQMLPLVKAGVIKPEAFSALFTVLNAVDVTFQYSLQQDVERAIGLISELVMFLPEKPVVVDFNKKGPQQ